MSSLSPLDKQLLVGIFTNNRADLQDEKIFSKRGSIDEALKNAFIKLIEKKRKSMMETYIFVKTIVDNIVDLMPIKEIKIPER